MHAGCGLEQVFIGTIHVRDAPEEEHLLTRRKTMMCRHKKKNDLEREEIHVFGYDLMVRMLICYFGKWIRILSNNIILVLFGSED